MAQAAKQSTTLGGTANRSAAFAVSVSYYPRFRDGTLSHSRQTAYFIDRPADPWAWAYAHYDALGQRDRLPAPDLLVDVGVRDETGWRTLPRPTRAFRDLCRALLDDPALGAVVGRDDDA